MKTNKSVNMAKATVDIVCPTFNNPKIFGQMLGSLMRNTSEPFRLIIVNNGTQLPPLFNDNRIVLLNSDKNLGWMGGVNAGVQWALAHDPAKFIMWINDDIQILDQDYGWLTKMLNCFQKPGVGAVGPTSNAVMGYQSIQHQGLPPAIESTMLSGMCFLTTREVIEKVGFLDESLPGGDDLDYSIRVRAAGYKLCICRRSFMLHHYATTGKRIHGDYWDSVEHSEAINKALIQKHGFKVWYRTTNHLLSIEPGFNGYDFVASEEKLALEELEEYKGKLVLDLGCGGKKLAPWVVGVDIRPSGATGVGYNANVPSAADVNYDVTDLKELKDSSVDAILAKHLLEHIIEPIPALKEWGRVLKDNGKLVVIVPDYRYCESMGCDPSHVSAFTPNNLTQLLEAAGCFKVTRVENIEPGYVLMISAEKVPARVGVLA